MPKLVDPAGSLNDGRKLIGLQFCLPVYQLPLKPESANSSPPPNLGKLLTKTNFQCEGCLHGVQATSREFRWRKMLFFGLLCF